LRQRRHIAATGHASNVAQETTAEKGHGFAVVPDRIAIRHFASEEHEAEISGWCSAGWRHHLIQPRRGLKIPFAERNSISEIVTRTKQAFADAASCAIAHGANADARQKRARLQECLQPEQRRKP
jgi:hypothetical protein